ncbi:MAG TPA: alpha-L-rhamnosidase [Kiritimatiellia bacterium]|nr:alpha-L-rhamnosidase [Kiritimatiellia bacterium]HPS06227.1 alpha-L-rhamnosidase [Kiritimatiellia bacterium]
MGTRFLLGAWVGCAFCAFAETRVERVFLPERLVRGNTGMAAVQEIDSASWIWHPTVNGDLERGKRVSEFVGRKQVIYRFSPRWDDTVFLRFKNTFTADGKTPVRIHVSGDERYVLQLDGRIISRGPDRGTVERWCYSSYDLTLDAGVHTLEAVVYQIGPSAPMAQLSWRGGFILKAEGAYDKRLTTGKGPWKVAALEGNRLVGMGGGAWGTGMQIEMAGCSPVWKQPAESAYVAVAEVRGPVGRLAAGLNEPGWRLYPSSLPDQIERDCTPGRFRAAVDTAKDGVVFKAADANHAAAAAANALLSKQQAWVVPAHQEVAVLWDLEDYYCAYPQLTVSGGAGAVIKWGWTESPTYGGSKKGNRSEFAGKKVECVTDAFLLDGGTDRVFTTHWWRCGKWCLLRVQTADQPVTLKNLAITESRYPLAYEGSFASDDPTLDAVQKICLRGMQMCSHEMFFDCPYYEQQMYPGDTRVQLQVVSALTGDDRLIRRAIELYDFSRREDGMVGMNFPTYLTQDSATYTLIWPLMFRDYVMWHDNVPWLKARMPGLRATMHGMELYENGDGLLDNLPGWSFMDWVPSFPAGVAPDGYGVSSLNNLFYVHALQSAAVAEEAVGNAELAQYWRMKAERVAQKVVATFWSAERGMIADTVKKDRFSEHAQCLALLAGILPADQEALSFKGLVTAPDLARTTVYFSHYLFDTYTRYGRTDLTLKRFDLWRDYVKNGMCTPLESPGDARSDCHAWGSHPIYHLHAGIAGVTPASPCFRSVRVAPQPGGLKKIASKTPHPKGFVELDLTFEGDAVRGTVKLPDGVPGEFVWRKMRMPLKPGLQDIRL